MVLYRVLIKAQGSRLKALSLKGETALEDDGFSLSSAQASSSLSHSLSLSLDRCACLESPFGYLVDTHVSLVL